ncbi:MAG: mannose-1-phosphate guanylyltransferase/mannose-6-phosphate isomerase [Pseudomonadota bacterium]
MRTYPVILSGGSGTRLWPLSRADAPKQFIDLLGTGRTLFAETLHRLPPSDQIAAPIVACNLAHAHIVEAIGREAGVPPREILLEPMARNTGPAIAAAALAVLETDPTGVMVVMPSDHVIADVAGFRAAVRSAAEVARRGRLVLFGIRPTGPETGYGYIKRRGALGDGAFEVDSFKEKPDLATAESYLASRDFDWNSGIFVMQAGTLIEELSRYEPEIATAASKAYAAADRDGAIVRLDPAHFAEAPGISIDYAVMERTDKAAVLPISVGWSDVGSWSSLWDIGARCADGNVLVGEAARSGRAILQDTRNSYVRSTRSVVATIGVEDLVIVETADALLVAQRSRAQDTKNAVTALKDAGAPEGVRHPRRQMPWGVEEALSTTDRAPPTIRRIDAGAEAAIALPAAPVIHWFATAGAATLIADGVREPLCAGEAATLVGVPEATIVADDGAPFEFIEVQATGDDRPSGASARIRVARL